MTLFNFDFFFEISNLTQISYTPIHMQTQTESSILVVFNVHTDQDKTGCAAKEKKG